MPVKKETANLSVPVYSLAGKSTSTLSLPKEFFGVKVNEKLLAQAVRVYSTNQKSLPGSTKTRGGVRGSTIKIWKQKGTGRARHGARTAPIFVGGGIAFGPKPRNIRLDMPKKMKRLALISALSAKLNDKQILAVTGLEKATGKTKEIAKLVNSLDKKNTSILIVTAGKMDNVVRAVRNIPEVDILPVNQANAYEALRHKLLVITKDTVDALSAKKKD